MPQVIVISGPSGVGKDAVLRELQQQRPDLYFVVTATSRCAAAPAGRWLPLPPRAASRRERPRRQAGGRGARSPRRAALRAAAPPRRAMRPGEVEGKDYFFVGKQQFEQWIEQGQLLEHAVVYGEYKGIPRGQVGRAGGPAFRRRC